MTALRFALAGLAALAVAMGIGRFAFTPILPMMLHDGVVDLRQASWLASANYLGYLAGALLCTFDPWLRRRFGVRRPADAASLVHVGLAATALLTLAMALPWPATWPTLRFAAGVASAYVLVYSSGWCLANLAARGAPSLGGLMFAGPGVGIVAGGLLAGAMVSWHWRASTAWIALALLAGAVSAVVWNVFRQDHPPSSGNVPSRHDSTAPESKVETAAASPAAAVAVAAPPPAPGRHGSVEVAILAFGYGLAGFGYIITATFLPVIARAAIPGSPLIDLFWPIFGAGIICGALLASRLSPAIDRRSLLASGYLVQAAGIGLGVVWPTEAGFAVGSLLLGLPATLLALFALEEARRIRPLAAASTIGLVTALYALGQVLGPPMVAALLRRGGGDAHAAFRDSLVIAAVTLLIGAAMFVASARVWPAGRRAAA